MKDRIQNKISEEGFIFVSFPGSTKHFADICFFFYIGVRSDSKMFFILQVCSGLYSCKMHIQDELCHKHAKFPHIPVYLHTFHTAVLRMFM